MEAEHESHKGSGSWNVKHWILSNKLNFAALLIYLVLALVVFYPVSTHLTTAVAGYGGDPYQTLWNLWWVSYSTFTLHQSFWSTSLLFWPVGANLIYQTLMPIGALLVAPFEAISLVFAYNVLFFIGIVLSGFGMFVLADYIVKNKYAAFIAGVIFAFSAFHIAQAYGHLDYANIEWVPISLYFFLRVINRDYLSGRYGRYLTAVMLSVAFILSLFMGDIEQGVLLLITFVLIAVLYLISKSLRALVLSREFVSLMIMFVVVTLVLGSWAFIPILSGLSGSTLNQLNGISNNMLYSDDLLSFFLPSYYNGIFNGAVQGYISIYHGDIGETTSYIGYVVIALAAYGIYKTRRPAYMWVVLGVVFFLLALGPYILVNNLNTGIPGPYLILKYLPITNILREPGRFDLLFSIVAAILAAYGAKALFERMSGPHENPRHSGSAVSMVMVATIIISLLIILETATPPLSGAFASGIITNPGLSPLFTQLGKVQGSFSVLELPILPNPYSSISELYPGEATYSTILMHKPVIGGYLTRENASEEASLYNIPLIIQAQDLEAGGNLSYASVVSQNYTNQTLLGLYLYNTSVVTLNEDAYNASTLNEIGGYMEGVFGAPIYNYENQSVIAWSTQSAINRTLFRSYVTFPNPLYWNENIYQLNGTEFGLWSPVGGGLILVYAPYLNSTTGLGAYELNTSVTVSTAATGPAILEIGQEESSGASVIAKLNITSGFRNYTFSTELATGGYGNALLFSLENESSLAGILRITFRPGKQ